MVAAVPGVQDSTTPLVATLVAPLAGLGLVAAPGCVKPATVKLQSVPRVIPALFFSSTRQK